MSAIVVDSNILLDLLTGDPVWSGRSSVSLSAAAQTSRLIINAVIYAEVSLHFSSIDELEVALPAKILIREPVPFEAAFLAGRAYIEYRRRGGARRSPLPDFFIGAHAAVAGYRLLTRDPSGYRSYFPRLQIIAP